MSSQLSSAERVAGSAPHTNSYRLRTFTQSDLELAHRWLNAPEVVRWWGDPEEQFGLLRQDLDEPRMRQWIGEYCGLPFAYLQAYEAHAWPQGHLQTLPAGTQVIDLLIGEPHMMGHGHGSALLRTVAAALIHAGATGVAIDPAADNIRARRAFARAGFEEVAVVQADEGPVALMVFCKTENDI